MINLKKYQRILRKFQKKYKNKIFIENKKDFFHDLIFLSSKIEEAIIDLIKSKIAKENNNSEIVKGYISELEKKSTLFSLNKLIRIFMLSFKTSTNISRIHKISKNNFFKKYKAFIEKRNEYAHTASTEINKDILIMGFLAAIHFLDLITKSIR